MSRIEAIFIALFVVVIALPVAGPVAFGSVIVLIALLSWRSGVAGQAGQATRRIDVSVVEFDSEESWIGRAKPKHRWSDGWRDNTSIELVAMTATLLLALCSPTADQAGWIEHTLQIVLTARCFVLLERLVREHRAHSRRSDAL